MSKISIQWFSHTNIEILRHFEPQNTIWILYLDSNTRQCYTNSRKHLLSFVYKTSTKDSLFWQRSNRNSLHFSCKATIFLPVEFKNSSWNICFAEMNIKYFENNIEIQKKAHSNRSIFPQLTGRGQKRNYCWKQTTLNKHEQVYRCGGLNGVVHDSRKKMQRKLCTKGKSKNISRIINWIFTSCE